MPKSKVLLVDSDQDSDATLCTALTEAGYEVVSASSGSIAVGALEWERPDLIVSRAQVHDMDGYELFCRVRKDPTTMDTPYLLLAGRDRPVALAAGEAGVDAIVTGDITAEVVVSRARELLKPEASDAMPRPTPREPSAARKPAEPLWAAFEATSEKPSAVPPSAAFQGSLDVMDLAEVTQAVGLGGKTGCLTVSLAEHDGAILFENGRVVHARFGGRTGERAFGDIITASQRETHGHFRFDRMDRAAMAQEPRTISRSVDQLLLTIAVGIDEAEPGAAPLEGASPGRRADG